MYQAYGYTSSLKTMNMLSMDDKMASNEYEHMMAVNLLKLQLVILQDCTSILSLTYVVQFVPDLRKSESIRHLARCIF